MDVENYFRSLGLEIDALKHRVRQIIASRHWQTDGAWKESVIRQVLRRHLPQTAIVGRGFVITEDHATTELDVLIYDSSKPVLFRDGDLAFVTPDAVYGIVEVKSRVTIATFGDAVEKLSTAIELVRRHPNPKAFAALFAFEVDAFEPARFLGAVSGAAAVWDRRLSFACFGQDRFIRYWHFDPLNDRRMYQSWHSYRLEGLAQGYFVHNVVDAVTPQSVVGNRRLWWPDGGKEPHRDGVAGGAWAGQQN